MAWLEKDNCSFDQIFKKIQRKSNPEIQSWMRSMNFTDFHHLEAYYSAKLLAKAKKLNKKVNIWQDVYDNGVQVKIENLFI